MDEVAAWIGRRETATDVAVADRVADLMALLDDPAPPPDVLPPLGHWLLFRPRVAQSAVGPDGHAIRDDRSLLPPILLPQRMWAASAIEFLRAIPLGAPVVRHTVVADIVAKQGRSGAMVFVTLDHEILHDGAVAIRERQHLVYRGVASQSLRRPVPVEPNFAATVVRRDAADPVALFRYSALTGNAHRIHYDRDYARSEGYPGLVVHGPYAATLLLDQFRRARPDVTVASYAFRARAPLFDGSPFELAMAGQRLWIVDGNGAVAMTAEVSW